MGRAVVGKEVGRSVLNTSACCATGKPTPILVDPPLLLGPTRAVETASPWYVSRNYIVRLSPFCFYSRSAHAVSPRVRIRATVFRNGSHEVHLQAQVPVGQMITRQHDPLTAALLYLVRPLRKDVARMFRVVQRVLEHSEKGVTTAQNIPRLEEVY
jgi:hypothetical protein